MLHIGCPYSTRIWAWFLLLSLLLSFAHAQAQPTQRNITILSTSPQIIYTPFLCNVSIATSNPQCKGAWQTLDLDGTTFVSTQGPAPESANIIPQMFLRFRASALYLSTSALSNSTTNITVSTNGTTTAVAFNSSVGVIAVLNLPETEVTTVALTYIPGTSPTRLDIGDLTLTVTDDPATSVFFPTATLPPSSALPTVTLQPSSTSVSSKPSNRKKIAEGVGIVLGLGLGLTTVAVVGYVFWRRRRRRHTQFSDSEAPRPTPVLIVNGGKRAKAWF